MWSALAGALPLFRRPRRVDVHGDFLFGPFAIDGQLDLVADPGKTDHVAQLGPAAHRDAVDGNDQVAALEAGLFGRRGGIDAGDDRAGGVRGVHRLREIGGQVLDRHADAAALYFAIANELVPDAARHADRHREAD